ncbi:MAG TPA: RsmB/NOP family class I SAM-dependent RNA methyltransferase, partial [Lachnospiraceae bacterium]|nr:RsmB/NOP family class I SAM-dependent RNA methyltransferase [Lachnospiraceae bacterium]
PSAMLPADRLPIKEGDRVLDLCAAPGGKSTALLAKLHGTGFLLSNDISYSRAQALLKNMEMHGASNFCVTAEEPQKLAAYYPGFFDKILVDAPCSGEGMFRKDAALISSWETKGPDYYAPIQLAILSAAVRMLKPGGLLLYSTCTFSEKENEGVIRELLNSNPELTTAAISPYDGFSQGRMGLTDCVRIFPHRMAGEGHFLALLKKENTPVSRAAESPSVLQKNGRSFGQAGADLEAFLSFLDFSLPKDRLLFLNGMLYLLPENYTDSYHEALRYVRSGILIGEIDKRGTFKPSQAFAMHLSYDRFRNTMDLALADLRVIKYLKGETIFYSSDEVRLEKGYVLICVDGYPLGFGKVSVAGTIKNKYKPGWRMMG